MAKQSLGLIETVGLAAAVEAADAAVKSANVNLVGYELTKGGGMVTVKLEGEVGAVNAAIAAASVAAAKVGQVYAHKVIARTAEGIEAITHSAETVGVAKPEPLAPEVVITPPAVPEPETKATTIPVVTLEPSDNGTSCGDISEPPAPAPQPAAQAPAAPDVPPKTEPEQSAKKTTPRPMGKNTPRKGDK
ncbi:BMC domain-containing protein [Candidatus Symbiopectobacterium sp. NZEC151]|uniref:BMC domain-containing protein n=1 Tax=Candidatus Symbiopectobacterium sp. NZEC151 TaxID=2820470 RepID=UPI0029CAAD74|nr:BMC domain-containing protein [Candidatus Symbiopectobacterium sp. NZEC151]MCW2475207.1 BMC domain-containing protein [Candidatus Symbiopectobacterium sp. NZEC151]